MFSNEVQQLRDVLTKVVTTGADCPQNRILLNQAYDCLVGAILSLEQVEGQPVVFGTGAVADLYEAITQEERLRELL